MQHPGLKLKVDTLSISSSMQEAVTPKPSYRGPMYRNHCHFVLWWRLQCVFHSAGIINCSRWSKERKKETITEDYRFESVWGFFQEIMARAMVSGMIKAKTHHFHCT
jgi:hypothetical protein